MVLMVVDEEFTRWGVRFGTEIWQWKLDEASDVAGGRGGAPGALENVFFMQILVRKPQKWCSASSHTAFCPPPPYPITKILATCLEADSFKFIVSKYSKAFSYQRSILLRSISFYTRVMLLTQSAKSSRLVTSFSTIWSSRGAGGIPTKF
jgi:hypothetical protein